MIAPNDFAYPQHGSVRPTPLRLQLCFDNALGDYCPHAVPSARVVLFSLRAASHREPKGAGDGHGAVAALLHVLDHRHTGGEPDALRSKDEELEGTTAGEGIEGATSHLWRRPRECASSRLKVSRKGSGRAGRLLQASEGRTCQRRPNFSGINRMEHHAGIHIRLDTVSVCIA